MGRSAGVHAVRLAWRVRTRRPDGDRGTRPPCLRGQARVTRRKIRSCRPERSTYCSKDGQTASILSHAASRSSPSRRWARTVRSSAADVRLHVRVGDQIAGPRRVLRLAPVRADDEERVAVGHVLHLVLAALPGLRARGDQGEALLAAQRDRAEPAAGEPVERAVHLDHDRAEGGEPRLLAEPRAERHRRTPEDLAARRGGAVEDAESRRGRGSGSTAGGRASAWRRTPCGCRGSARRRYAPPAPRPRAPSRRCRCGRHHRVAYRSASPHVLAAWDSPGGGRLTGRGPTSRRSAARRTTSRSREWPTGPRRSRSSVR